MTLKLNLSPELEQRLKQEAQRRGIALEAYALQLLDSSLGPREKLSEQLVALLQSWIDEEEDTEQTETGDYLVQVLDEDRLSDRKLFPPELKGVTW